MSPFKLLLNGEVYAPLPRGRCHVLVAHDRVVWMGPEAPVLPDALGTEEIDLEGKRVVPGLVDGHVHLAGGGGEGGFGHRTPPVAAADLLRGGTTTVVGVLGTDDVTRSPAELVAAARRLDAGGVTAFCLTGGYHLPAATVTGSVTGDIVHIDPVIGVGEIALSDHRSSHPTTADLVRVAGEAHLGGVLAGKAGQHTTCISATVSAAWRRSARPWKVPTCLPASFSRPTSTDAVHCLTRRSTWRPAAATSM